MPPQTSTTGVEFNDTAEKKLSALFPRYRSKLNPSIPDLNPAKIAFDSCRLALRFIDGSPIDTELSPGGSATSGRFSSETVPDSVSVLSESGANAPTIQPDQLSNAGSDAGSSGEFAAFFDLHSIKSASWNYAKYGMSQPLSITLSNKVLAALIRVKRNMGILEWLKSSPNIDVELFVSTRTANLPAGDEPVFYKVAVGTLDIYKCVLNNDHVTLACRDTSAILWEQKLWGAMPAPTVFDFIAGLGATFGINAIISIYQNGVDVGSVDFEENPLFRPVGIKDARVAPGGGQEYFFVASGTRYWDLLQQVADIADAQAFFMRGVLFFINDNALKTNTGRFILEWGRNIKSFEFDHASLQSTGSVLVMAVSDQTAGANGIPSGGTYYLTVSGREGIDVKVTTTRPKASQFGKRKLYVVERQNINPQQAVAEAQKLYRDVVQKEVVCSVEIAGHAYADLLERYTLRGMPEEYRELNDIEFNVQQVQHTIDVNGWTAKLLLNSEVDIA